MDAYLTAYVSNNEFSGVALIATGDSILFKKSYGFVDVDSQQRFSVNTRFRVASVTKTFTAAAIVMLRDRGLLKLTDPLSRFIPDYPKGDSITIVHLLLPSGWNSNQRPQQA
ncbi:MAG: serine hydrolase domain-containing protein [Bacteroidota bacterium]